ncbi:MAG: hypothetical protein A3F17_05765 [Gammaproteobacteria bacterium RIFCSPHIGHO2_12_FULL_41_15]|nr:MAG: hypothetical protein A3F17_05765 [Gammaproteobacteria bacterium RIFCSPHIGHO2_12_FULL_41_15]
MRNPSLLLIFLLFTTTNVFTLGSRIESPGTFYNPATLTSQRMESDPGQLADIHDRKILLGLAINKLNVNYNGNSSFINPPVSATASGIANSNTTRYVPAFNWSIRLNPRWIAGIKVGEPFNAALQYPEDSSARYTGYQSSVMAVSIGPELAYQFNQKLSIGFGAEMQRVWFNFAAAVPIPNGAGGTVDYTFGNQLEAWGGGWFAGLFYNPRIGSYLGLTFYSAVSFHLSGDSTLTGSGGIISNKTVQSTANMTTPWSLRLDGFQALNRRWGINGSIEYVQWSMLQRILLQNTALGAFSQQYSYKDTWRYALGLRFQPAQKWSFFAGAAYHESPSNPHLQRPLTPDKHFVSAGFAVERYFTRETSLKINYRHGFVGKNNINYSTPITSAEGVTDAAANTVDLVLTIRK